MPEYHQSVPPLTIVTDQFSELIRGVKAFLRQECINNAVAAVSRLESDGNPFRTMLLREKQPWLYALSEFDRLTLRGSRPLPNKAITDGIFFLAYLGALLREIRGTLPRALADRFRARFLDLHGKSFPALMEWETAFFYKRHGFLIGWNDVNVKGAEFCATRDNLVTEVECKQFSRNFLEELSDRPANDLGDALLSALAAASLSGTVELCIAKDDLANVNEFCRDFAEMAKSWHPGPIDITVGAASVIKGTLYQLGQGPLATAKAAGAEAAKKPHDARSFARGFRSSTGQHEAVVVWLKGPRRSVENFITHMRDVLLRAAQEQLQIGRPGVLVAEIEGFDDPTIFKEQDVFSQISAEIFDKAKHVASIVWRCGVHAERTENGFSLVHDAFRLRNANCSFPEVAQLPAFDMIPNEGKA